MLSQYSNKSGNSSWLHLRMNECGSRICSFELLRLQLFHLRNMRPQGRTITFEVGWTGSCWMSRLKMVSMAHVSRCGSRIPDIPIISCGMTTPQPEQFAANWMTSVSTGTVNTRYTILRHTPDVIQHTTSLLINFIHQAVDKYNETTTGK